MPLNKWCWAPPRVALIGVLALSGCDSERSGGQGQLAPEEKESTAAAKPSHKEVGEASWYGPRFQGSETANGESFDPKKMTAAHPSLPMGTKALVTNLENGMKVEVTINDRGPYAEDRAIDLSSGAAKKLDMKKDGIAQVTIETNADKKKKRSAAGRATQPMIRR